MHNWKQGLKPLCNPGSQVEVCLLLLSTPTFYFKVDVPEAAFVEELFHITLSATQPMDHSFDGISIKLEEGARDLIYIYIY